MQMTPYSDMLAKEPQSGPCMIETAIDDILAARTRREPEGKKKQLLLYIYYLLRGRVTA
jgi:hypothetical protein